MSIVKDCFRLLPFERATGADNMAADEVLLHSAVAGVASLRFYGWSEATVSLGYFQPVSAVREQLRLASLPLVRRPTGGSALVHHHELTYALALPAKHLGTFQKSWLVRMHGIIAAALSTRGIACQLVSAADSKRTETPLCFQRWTAGDLLLAGHKIAGSAQRRHRHCLLQHGAILLTASPHAPGLPGIHELCRLTASAEDLQSSIQQAFCRQTGWDLVEETWTTDESRLRQAIALQKRSSASWTEKR